MILLAALVLNGGCETYDFDAVGPAEVVQAGTLLSSRHVTRPALDRLLKTAWSAAIDQASEAGIDTSLVEPPAYVGSDDAGKATNFKQAFEKLVKTSRNKLSENELSRTAIQAMVELINDSHTAFIPAHRWREAWSERGVVRYTPPFLYRSVRVRDGSFIWEVTPGSEVERAGLRPGDIVQTINFDRTSTVSVFRQGLGQIDLRVRAEPESMSPFEARMIGDIAYFYLYSFTPYHWESGNETFARNIEKSLRDLRDQRPRGWIIDLRDNGGGAENTLEMMAGALGLKGAIAEDIYPNFYGQIVTRTMTATGPDYVGFRPLVVLIDSNTASAAEILAYSLRNPRPPCQVPSSCPKVLLIGVRTAGAVQGSYRYPLDRGGGLSITVTMVKTGSDDRNLEGVGVLPDEEVPLDLDGILEGRDNQLERALEYLRTK